MESHEFRIVNDRRIAIVSRIDRHAPRDIEDIAEVKEELLLVFLGWEIDTEFDRSAIGVVLRPVAKADLYESDTRVVVVALGEVGIELLGEPLELRVRPVGIISRTIASGVLLEGLLVVFEVFDVLSNGCATGYAIDLSIARILITEADNSLMVTRLHIVEDILEIRPIVLDLAIYLASNYAAWEAVLKLELDRLGIAQALRVGGPHHEARHRLYRSDFSIKRNHGEAFFRFETRIAGAAKTCNGEQRK
jgi:hypothetical protein